MKGDSEDEDFEIALIQECAISSTKEAFQKALESGLEPMIAENGRIVKFDKNGNKIDLGPIRNLSEIFQATPDKKH